MLRALAKSPKQIAASVTGAPRGTPRTAVERRAARKAKWRAARETGLSMRDWSPKILVREAMRQVKGAKAGGLIRGKGPMKGSGG